ncbi:MULTISPECIES: hypothetical protein [unclassified Microbacterium]|nr:MULTISPECIES: hypothetical protein [unclassified Microbacterium]TQK20832.1 hypothetical protein FBY40_3376 [Microbacterium sp. SLBN-154]
MSKSTAFLLSIGGTVLVIGLLLATLATVAAAALLIFGGPVLDGF